MAFILSVLPRNICQILKKENEEKFMMSRLGSFASAFTVALIVFGGNNSSIAEEIILQPGPNNGKDIWTTSVFSYTDEGGGPGGGLDNEHLRVGGWGDYYHSLLEFDLTELPAIAASARIELYAFNRNTQRYPTGIWLDRITEFWDWRTQGTGVDRERMWWIDRPNAVQWNQDVSQPLPVPAFDQWYTIDITNLYNAWQASGNGIDNFGIQLRPASINQNQNSFYSSNYLDDPTLRPKLVINYNNNNNPPSLQFSSVADTETDTPFPVTIEARLSNGLIDTSFNQRVNLHTNHDSLTVDILYVDLINGTATESIMLSGSGSTDVKLEATYRSITGSSNSLTVTDPSAVPTKLIFTVGLDGFSDLALIGDVTVYLKSPAGFVVEQTKSDFGFGYGDFLFSVVLGGEYEVWAVNQSGDLRSSINNKILISTAHYPKHILKELPLRETGKPPVLLVPGMMGSTNECVVKYAAGKTPTLPRNPYPLASELCIFNGVFDFGFNTAAEAGFDDLDRVLQDQYNVIPVPWDWRATLEESTNRPYRNAWHNYLIPAIEAARNPIPEPDGEPIIYEFDKVDVVAHSMGGLVVRAYIQSAAYANDINKFAMVGTPNQGSANAYYMAQGGNPGLADDIAGKCTFFTTKSNPYCFYSRATDAVYREMKIGESPFVQTKVCVLRVPMFPFLCLRYNEFSDYSKVISPEKLIQFYDEEVPTGRQLTPTYSTALSTGALMAKPNTTLQNLNNDTDLDRMVQEQDCSDPKKVRTTIFASSNEPTLVNINVDPRIENAIVYPDGAPNGSPAPETNGGDGTVPLISAYGALGLNVTINVKAKGKHSFLMGAFKDEIAAFLNAGCSQ
jgi:hypothetical protein